MRALLFITIFTTACMIGSMAAQATSVRGHVRKDGTYVQPHHRTAPNSSMRDNYSTQGRINPYTGQMGTKNPLW
jgi:hypothetical protein